MNGSVLVSISLTVGVLWYLVSQSMAGVATFLNLEAFAVVIGGTVAAGLFIFPGKSFLKIIKLFFNRVLFSKGVKPEEALKILVELGRGARSQADFLSTQVDRIRVPFLKEGVEMFVKAGMPNEEIQEILEKRISVQYEIYEEDAKFFRTLARFPPAFGLLGTTFGMINLMSNLGGDDAFKKIGPAMAIALVATLYGVGIANFVLIPFSEKLSKLNREDILVKKLIIDGLALIHDKVHPLVLEEHLKSYLLPGNRKDFSANKLKRVA